MITRVADTQLTASRQQGLGLIGLLFWIAVFGFLFLMAMRVTPAINEYLEIRKAVKQVLASGDANAIRNAFDAQSRANYIDNFSGKDLVIETTNGITTLEYEYQRVIPVAGPLNFLLKFSHKELVR